MPVGLAGSGFGIHELVLAVLEDELELAVGVDILQQHELARHAIGHDIAVPAARLSLGLT
jgi:hypothetical protein